MTAVSRADFDYGDLAPADVESLERYACEIRTAKGMAAAGVLKLGAELKQVQELLAGNGRDGLFLPWLKAKCRVSKSSAYNALAAYETFGKCPTVGHLFECRALYLLSADSCPEDATKEAIKRAKKGEEITAKIAREIKEKYTPQDEDAGSEVEIEETEDGDEPPSQPASDGFDFNYQRQFLFTWVRDRMELWPAEHRKALSQILKQLSEEALI